ncbi:hypothetical protein HG536_0C04610 [Torulaspora globosa]|uniref:Plasma membrane fusion protein PRM1 n=1 Tax=Torulaspora globosa TaxID=48254 RepID=A0A7G3ZFK6_9SACH|nr:uncharacterized protein HG536_0C04610 [Torulaspora globosa]QLL32292.1 hypothetical protein HG536_0C04610 [Torulaspora globosa]
MPYLLSVPSLPKRLLRCPFEPVALTLILTSLLSIWSSYTLIVLNVVATSDIGPAASPTVTASSTATVTTSLAPTTTLQASVNLNESAIETAIDKYSRRKIDHVNDWINSQVLSPLCSEWQQDLKHWNDSLNVAMDTKIQDYNSFLAFKNRIVTQFQQDSARINETLDILSRTALTVGSLNSQELAQNFTVRYWTIDDLFANISSSMTEARTVFEKVQTPTISCPVFSLTFTNISADLANITSNLTAALSDIAESGKSVLSTTEKGFNRETSLKVARHDETLRILHNRCSLLTLVTCAIYFTTVIFLCAYEILKFSLERSTFNLHMADMLDQYFTRTELYHDEIKSQQKIRSTTQNLIFSLQESTVHKVSEIIYSKLRFKLNWPRLTTVCWWIWSSGRIFWILFFYAAIHYQMMLSIVRVHPGGTTELGSTSMSKSTLSEMHGANLTFDSTSIYLMSLQACKNFEQSFDKVLTGSVNTYLTDLANAQINEINSKMVSQVTPFDTISWENITSVQALSFSILPASDDEISLGYSIISEVIRPSVSIIDTTTQKMRLKTSEKELSTEQNKRYLAKSCRLTYKWALIALIMAAIIHHLLGSIILTWL